MPGLRHPSLRRVLQSLILSTLSSLHSRASQPPPSTTPWSDGFLLNEAGEQALGCDSLEMLQVSSAVNEMFHLYEVGFETRLLQTATFGDWLAIIEDAWKRGVERLTVTTSGSSGIPKPCTHAFAALELEAVFLADLFSSRRRIVAYTPAHHVYGLLFAGFLPDRLGVPVIDLQHAGTSPHTEDGNRGGLHAGDLVVSFPDGWQWIERNLRAMPHDLEGVCSTAPCPRSLIESLMAGRLSRFVEIYGSSETAGIGTRVWPELRYRLMPHLQFLPTSPDQPVQLQLRSGRHLESMDHLQSFEDGTFLIQGRKDTCVQVGGVNVSPLLIERRLREAPGVAEVAVRLMRPDEGNRLKCFIVPCDGQDIARLEQALWTRVASWPVAAERPRDIRCGSALPRNSAGKLADW